MLCECRMPEVHHCSGGLVHTSFADAPKVGEAVLFDGGDSGEHCLIVDDDHGDDHEQCHGKYDNRPPLQRPHQPVARCLREVQNILKRMLKTVPQTIPCCSVNKLRCQLQASIFISCTHHIIIALQ